MTNKKVSNLNDARRKKRAKTGMTMKEIIDSELKRAEKHKHLSKDEPPHLYSGDMDKVIRGEDDDDHDEVEHD